MSRLRFPVAPAAGIAAVALAILTLASQATHGLAASPFASAVFAAAGGGVALWHSERLSALVVADALLAGAVLVDLFGLGAIFVLPLLGMLVATVDTPARRPRPKHLRPSGVVSFAAGPLRQLPLRRSA